MLDEARSTIAANKRELRPTEPLKIKVRHGCGMPHV
jgi:hypothetical protein